MAARKAGLGKGAGIRGRGQRVIRSLIGAIDVLADQGAEGTIRGCMEQSFILDEDDGVIPGFDTTRIHAIVAVDAAMDYLRVRGPALESRFSRAGQSSTSPLNVNEDTPSTS